MQLHAVDLPPLALLAEFGNCHFWLVQLSDRVSHSSIALHPP